MGQCSDCPRLTDAAARCCMDGAVQIYSHEGERLDTLAKRKSYDLLLPIPGRSAARGEVTHKLAKDMNRKERRAFNSNKSR